MKSQEPGPDKDKDQPGMNGDANVFTHNGFLLYSINA
jgi:hypothetical protein